MNNVCKIMVCDSYFTGTLSYVRSDQAAASGVIYRTHR